jgi:hypothetical protein
MPSRFASSPGSPFHGKCVRSGLRTRSEQGNVRLSFFIGLAIAGTAIAILLWYMVAMPGRSQSGALPPLTASDRVLAERLRQHVTAIAAREHNLDHPTALEGAARYIEQTLATYGHDVKRQPLAALHDAVRNIEIEIAGQTPATGIVIVGAHYDSVQGAPGANDNASGVAAALELARVFAGWQPTRTWRIVLFVNEEPPYYRSELMGSFAYVERVKARNEHIVAMYSLETIGYYDTAPQTQHYPFPLGLFYPNRGDFLAFVANLASRRLLHQTIGTFRAQSPFPSEGVAAPAFIPGVDWSDQWAFWRAGYRAVMITDTALYRYPYYHTALDTPDKVDYERLAHVVHGLAATFRALDPEL